MGRENGRRGEDFLFREVHPRLLLGTTSDRYAGWLGQIYTPSKYEGRIIRRKKVLGGKTFVDEVLPIESVREYFEHFSLLEIDFTFYRNLLDAEGNPTSNFHVLRSYGQHIGDRDGVVLKVPQTVFARKMRREGRFVANPDFLNPDLFLERFYRPALEILGDRIRGFIFEQEYQKKKNSWTSISSLPRSTHFLR